MRPLLQFTSLDRKMPDQRVAAERRRDFREIYEEFDPAAARAQASRCSQCGIPYCQVHCPLSNNIPDWLMLTAEGRLEEAYELAAATNNFPEICGRICPQDRLCEGNCVIEKGFQSVTIGAVERFLTEIAFAKGWVKPPRPARERAATIGIVGAGPAGLAAAEELRRLGYGVHVYDRHDRIGGLLIYGIPNFKLDKEVVARRHRLLEEGGVVFHLGVELGRDVGLDELRRRHEAVLLATGVYRPRPLASPGVALQGVVEALDYLTASNRKGLGEKVPRFDSGVLNAAGRDVVVVGGGDTAMDCVRTAVRQGAKSVRCLYRRDRRNMPGSAREVRHAEEEGVEFVWLAAPEAVRGEGTVREIRAHRMHLGTRDGSGRQAPLPVAASHFTLPAGLVILALGFDAEEWPEGFATELPARDRSGLIKVDHRGLMTSLPRVFAAGDVVRGASLVVWAVRDGRDAAASVHRSLETEASLAAAQ